MEERLLAAIQKLVDKGGANKRRGYDGCEIGYKECVAKKADMDKGLIKFDHIKRKLVMPDGSELPKGPGYLRPRVEKWHEERRSASASINMIATQHGYGMPAGVVYPQGFGPKAGNTSTFAMVTPSQLMSLYEKRAEAQAAQLMACLEEQSDDEEEEEDPTIKVLKQILQEWVKAKKDGRPPGKRPGKPFKKVEVVIPSAGANQPSTMVPASTEPPIKEPAPAPDTSAKAGTQSTDAKKDHQRQYKHTAPIIKSGTTEDLYNCVLDSKVEVSIKELCGESPGICNKLKEALTNRKVPVEGGKSGAAAVRHDQLLIMHLHTGRHAHIVVADEAGGLRALTPVIDGLHKVESVLDEGSQVVAMSAAVWRQCGLPLDPSVKIALTSANGETGWSLGLCRNVPFNFKGLEVLLQVHVVEHAAYDVLLG